MKAALGLKAHSGWSALVAVGIDGGEPRVLDRRRIELVDPEEVAWAKQPYHAAVGLDPDDARDVVERGIAAARRVALREMRAALKRVRESGPDVVACAVLVQAPMPEWSVAQILAVHFRMHKAEGVLFPDALVRAADECGLRVVAFSEKLLSEHAEKALATSRNVLTERIARLGKAVGSPWGKDQKSAALAAMIALHGAGASRD